MKLSIEAPCKIGEKRHFSKFCIIAGTYLDLSHFKYLFSQTRAPVVLMVEADSGHIGDGGNVGRVQRRGRVGERHCSFYIYWMFRDK